MRFYGGRFSLLRVDKNLFYCNGNEKKFSFITKSLSKRVVYKVRKDTTIIIEPILDGEGRLLRGKIGREAKRELPLSKELTRTSTKIYPHVLFIIIEEEQVILVERNTQVFVDELVVFKYLLKYLNRELIVQGLEVDLKPLTSKGGFWQLLKDMDKVFSVHFIFKAPNFLGDSYEDLRDILNKEKCDSNANQVEYVISNDAGQLHLEDTVRYKSAVGWIEDGAGEWRIKAKQKGKGKAKKVFKNSQQISTFEIEGKPETITSETISELRQKVDIGRHKTIDGENR